MDNHLIEPLRKQLLEVETELLDGLNNEASLDELSTRWEALTCTIGDYIDAGVLDQDTIAMIHATSTRLSIIAETIIELDTVSEELSNSLHTYISTQVFSTETASSSPSPPPSDRDHPSATQKYIKMAYGWLSENLHNPYPPICVRDNISAQSGAPRKDVDAWFIDARKRIGWTSIRKRFFNNKRAEAVKAAIQLIKENNSVGLDTDVIAAFSKMRSEASLYFHKYSLSALADNPHSVIPSHLSLDYPSPSRSISPESIPQSPGSVVSPPSIKRRRLDTDDESPRRKLQRCAKSPTRSPKPSTITSRNKEQRAHYPPTPSPSPPLTRIQLLSDLACVSNTGIGHTIAEESHSSSNSFLDPTPLDDWTQLPLPSAHQLANMDATWSDGLCESLDVQVFDYAAYVQNLDATSISSCEGELSRLHDIDLVTAFPDSHWLIDSLTSIRDPPLNSSNHIIRTAQAASAVPATFFGMESPIAVFGDVGWLEDNPNGVHHFSCPPEDVFAALILAPMGNNAVEGVVLS